MGRGIIQDVSARIIDQFSANLADMLGGGEEAPEAPADTQPETVPAAEAPQAASAEPAAAQASPPSPKPKPKPKAAPKPKPAPAADAELSAADLAGAVIAGRLKDPKVLVGVLAGAVVLGYLVGAASCRTQPGCSARQAGHRGLVAERAVWAAMVVGPEPAVKGCGAFCA